MRRKGIKKCLAWLLLILQFSQPAIAGASVAVDKSAPANNRPYVEKSANGLPIVQITTPSAAGVSRNIFRQFAVDAQGLILNNSRDFVKTQLAGYITGNPFMANGTARIILTEVSGPNPSYLRGYTEIAGQRAEVVIANPNGIFIDGGGFINTNHATLTTGTPIFGGNGSLDAFRVTGGQITIQGAGMNASNMDRVDLISRTTAVNAELWAKNLQVVTGANTVQYNTLHTDTIDVNNKPDIALDVGNLGGMYANKILLMGTEDGVGVNSKGVIAAQSGDIIVTNAGKVVLGGSTTASSNIQIQAKDFSNQGTLYAGGNTNVVTQGDLANSGVLAAGQQMTLNVGSVHSTGTLGAGIKADGSLGTTGNLTFTSNGNISARGKTIAAGNLNMNATAIDITGGKTFANGAATLTATARGCEQYRRPVSVERNTECKRYRHSQER